MIFQALMIQPAKNQVSRQLLNGLDRADHA